MFGCTIRRWHLESAELGTEAIIHTFAMNVEVQPQNPFTNMVMMVMTATVTMAMIRTVTMTMTMTMTTTHMPA